MTEIDYTQTAEGIEIPDRLKQQHRWCRWSLQRNEQGRMTKKPDRSTSDVEALSPFEPGAMSDTRGIGFVFTDGVEDDEGCTLIAIDIDACRVPTRNANDESGEDAGQLTDWGREVIEMCGHSYTEVSPSGTGLRVFVFVRALNREITTKMRAPGAAAPGVDKNPEVQLFGVHGAAQYVTVTGQRLLATSPDILTLDNLDELIAQYRLDQDYKERGDGSLPEGNGERRTLEQIAERVRDASWKCEHLLKGDWDHEDLDYASPSEGYAAIVGFVLKAANGHGDLALDFLMDLPVWAAGTVRESADPGKYGRRAWVHGEVCRLHQGNADPDPARVFEPLGELPPEERPPSHKRARIVTFEEFDRSVQPERFLIDGLLPRTGLAQFFGDPGSGKTPFAMNVALAVALGEARFFNRDVDHHGKVLYMVGEDANGLGHRLRAELNARGLTRTDLQGRLFLTTQPGQLCDEEDAARWRDEIHAFGEFAMVVIDTQSRNFGAGNENDTQDMTRFVNNLARLAEQLQLLVVLVHHTGHKSKERARGSSVMFGALDASYEVTKEEIGDIKAVVAKSTKAKNWANPSPLRGTLVPVTLDIDGKGRPITAITLSQKAPEDQPLGDLVAAELEDDADLRALLAFFVGSEGEWVSRAKARSVTRLSDHKVKAKTRRLVEVGLLEIIAESATRGRQYRLPQAPNSEGQRGSEAGDFGPPAQLELAISPASASSEGQ